MTASRSGEEVSAIGLGGWHLGLEQVEEPLSFRIVHSAIDHGIKSKTVSPIECLHYALNLPTSVVITGIDRMEVLNRAFEAVLTFKPMPRQQADALLARTAQAAAQGRFEPFKTSSLFDSTAQNPSWLGDEPERLQELLKETTPRSETTENKEYWSGAKTPAAAALEK